MFTLNYNEYDAHVYETELKNFLPDSFIDIHTHVWKSTFKPYGASNGGATWTHLVADEQTAEDLLGALKTLYPGKTVTPLVFGGVDQDVRQCNDYVAETAAKYHYPTLLRTDYSMTADEVEREVARCGCIGLKPYLTNCPPYIPNGEIRIFDFLPHEHLEVANRHGWIVMLHIARAMRLRDPVNVAQLMEIERLYPNVKLIVAHIGRAYSKQDVGDAFETLRHTEHMLFDFTANLCDDAIRDCIEAVGTGRLMFGSDLPICNMRMYRITDPVTGFYKNVVPRGLYGDVSGDAHMLESDEKTITLMVYEQLRAFRRVAQALRLSDRQVEEIMYTNSKNLIDSMK